MDFKKGDKCRVSQTMNVNWEGDDIPLYDDNLGDTIEIIKKEDIKCDDITWYLVKNLTRGYEQYVPSTIIEKL